MRFLHVFYHHFHLLFALTHQAHESELCSPSVVLCTQTQFDVKSFCLEHEEGKREPTCNYFGGRCMYILCISSSEIKLCEKLDKHVVGKYVSENPLC